MSVNSVQGAGQKSNVLGGVLGSLKDTAVVAGTGLALGGLGGKLATLAPYKPSQIALDCQYEDIFKKAVAGKGIPEYLKKAGDDVAGLVKKGKAILNFMVKKDEADEMHKVLSGLTEEQFKNSEVQDNVKSFFTKNKKIQEGGFSKEEILGKLKSRSDKFGKVLKEKFNDAKPDDVGNSFVEKVKNLKNAQIDDIAEKGAKHLRNKSIIGAGMAIGLVSMLILNILKTTGIFSPRNKQDNVKQKQLASTNIQSHQG